MKKKIVSMITIAALALSFAACTAETSEVEPEVTYKVVGGISEPTRVWNEVEEASAEAPAEETAEEYIPDVLAMEPTAFVTNKVANTLTSDKDGEVIATLEEGTELTLVGTTGKGYYQTEDGAFISASDVEKIVVAEEEVVEEVAQTSTTTTTQTPATQQTPTTIEQSQPAQEQTYEEPQQTAEAPAQEQTYTEPAQTEQSTQTEETSGGWNTISYEEAEAIRSTCPHTNTWTGEGCDLETGEIRTTTVCLDCGTVLN